MSDLRLYRFSFVQLIAELNKIYDLKIFTVDNLEVAKA